MHSSCNPDQLCGSNLAVGEEDVKIDTKVTETSSVLKTDLEQEIMQKKGFFSPQSPVLQKTHVVPRIDGACSRTIALSLHPRDCLVLQKFSVGIWLLLCTSDGHRHIQSTLLAKV